MGATTPYGIYVHAPWCRVRCPYCAFNVYPDREADWERWAAGILREWTLRAVPGTAATLYFGGGTPSLAPARVLASLIAALPLERGAEVTVEVNPGSVDEQGLRDLIDVGVNRLSLGIQTFSPRHARLLNRGHSVADAAALLRTVERLPLLSWSVDLIFALPEQTLAELDHDLDTLIAGAPPHVSLYGLTVEPGTPLERGVASGRIAPLGDEQWRRLYDRIRSRLRDEGYDRYEVSNYARPGHRSRHNEATWRGGHYVGLGPGAHGFLPSGMRTENHGPVDAWLADPCGKQTVPTSEEAAVDYILTVLRHTDGLCLDTLVQRTGQAVSAAVLRPLVAAGLLDLSDGVLRVTDRGVPVADGLVRRVVGGLHPADTEHATRAGQGLGCDP